MLRSAILRGSFESDRFYCKDQEIFVFSYGDKKQIKFKDEITQISSIEIIEYIQTNDNSKYFTR